MNSKKAGNASEDEIEHINNGNDFEIEDIGTFDEPEKTSKPSEKSKSAEKSTSKSSEKVDSESDEEVEIVKDSPSEAFWFLEDGIVKSSKDVPSQGSKFLEIFGWSQTLFLKTKVFKGRAESYF